MTDRLPAHTSLRLLAMAASLVLPLACSSGGGSSGTGGSGGHASGGSAGAHMGGSGGHAPGGAAGSVGGAAGGPVGGAAGDSVGGAAGRSVGGAAGGSAGSAGGSGGHAPGGAAGGQAGGYAGAAGSAGGAAGGTAGAAGTGMAGSSGNAGAGGAGGGPLLLPSGNLIVNGDAEAAVGSTDGLPVTTPGWTATGEATAMQYGLAGYPASTDPGPANRGANLFIGGYMDALSTLTQTIDVSAYATVLDSGAVEAGLSGYFGGYAGQNDNAVLTATFENATGQALGQMIAVGGVTAADRNDTTGLIAANTQGLVPAGTRKVVVVLSMTRTDQTANDGYADNLSLAFLQYL